MKKIFLWAFAAAIVVGNFTVGYGPGYGRSRAVAAELCDKTGEFSYGARVFKCEEKQ